MLAGGNSINTTVNISEFTRTEARIHEFLSRIESGMTETEAGDTRESARAASEAQDLLDVYNIGRYLGTAREEADIKANPVPLVATRHVFFAEPSPGGTATSGRSQDHQGGGEQNLAGTDARSLRTQSLSGFR